MTNHTGFQISTGQRQLFLNDHGVAEVHSLSRTLHQPAKKGAVIKPDVRSGETEGTLLTEPFVLPSKRMFVNVDAYPDKDQWYWRYVSWRGPLQERFGSRWREEGNEADMLPIDLGELRIEVLDSGGDVAAVSEPMAGDHPRAEVGWGRGDLAALAGQVVSLRFCLRRGRLYSYWFE